MICNVKRDRVDLKCQFSLFFFFFDKVFFVVSVACNTYQSLNIYYTLKFSLLFQLHVTHVSCVNFLKEFKTARK